MYLQGLGRGTFQELPSLELETGDAIKSLSLNRSYCIAVLHAGKVVEWGMGICRERDSSPMSVPGSDESTSNINSLKNSNVTVGRKGSQIERDVDIATQVTAGASSAASSTMGTMRSSMALTRTIGMCPVRILSVACGGGHVVAIAEENILSSSSVSSPLSPSSTKDQPFRSPSTSPRTGVLTWGAGCSRGSGKGGAGDGSHVTEEQTQVLGLGGCGAANCWSCRGCATAQSSESAGRRQSGPHWVKGLPQEARPVCVAAGDTYSAVVLEQRNSIEEGSAAGDCYHHDVWTWGIGGSGQLGIVASSTVSNEVPSPFSANCEARPIHIPITDDEDSDESEDILAAREAESSEELRKRRKIAKFDNEAHTSAAREVESCSVRDLSLGPYHAALVDARGRVFTWGSGAHGQLGHGDALDAPTPTLVRHLLGISMRGRFGKRRGILLRDAPWPKHVAGSVGGDSCFSGIACGLWHTAVVSEDGALYAWGSGSFGQLGKTDAALTPSYSSSSPLSSPLPPPRSTSTRGQTFIQTSPQLVSEIEDHVVGVVAGSRHTAAVIADKSLGHRLFVLGTIGAVHGGPEADMEREKAEALRCVSAVASGPWSIAVCSCSAGGTAGH